MSSPLPYQDSYYDRQRTGSRRSAAIVLPIVFEYIRPASIVDVGCGVGTWLSAADQLGVQTLVGFEGAWVLDVPAEPGRQTVRTCELDKQLTIPADLPKKYDLALCIEVAEHLPEARSLSLVDDLCSLSDVVLFSAAVPGQLGSNHINEQWQGFWAQKFDAQGYLAFDVVRPVIWDNSEVETWYRQNLILYVKREKASIMGGLTPARMLNVMHPDLFGWRHKASVQYLLVELRQAVKRALKGGAR